MLWRIQFICNFFLFPDLSPVYYQKKKEMKSARPHVHQNAKEDAKKNEVRLIFGWIKKLLIELLLSPL
jgi:hypothetical protein